MALFSLPPLVIAGPTASGKSSLAMALALKHAGEIICADSRQFYAGMSIGTACPSERDKLLIPHHGYGMLNPLYEKFDAGAFVKFAEQTISDITRRGKRAIIVGGTGLYLRALYYGLGNVPKTDVSITKKLSLRADLEGLSKLYEELLSIDQASARAILKNDRYRIIRALEIYEATGQKPSRLRQSFKEQSPQFTAHWVYKKPDKITLAKNISERVTTMFNNGLIDEAIKLRRKLPPNHWALSVMGYQEALQFSDGLLSIREAEERTVIRHRQYAKRQFTWFNKEVFYRFKIS